MVLLAADGLFAFCFCGVMPSLALCSSEVVLEDGSWDWALTVATKSTSDTSYATRVELIQLQRSNHLLNPLQLRYTAFLWLLVKNCCLRHF